MDIQCPYSNCDWGYDEHDDTPYYYVEFCTKCEREFYVEVVLTRDFITRPIKRKGADPCI